MPHRARLLTFARNVLAPLLITLLPVQLYAATYYVDAGAPNASDDNPGAEAKPWPSISRATAADLEPGDAVQVKSGVYREEVTISLHKSEDCRVEECTVMFNNTRRFYAGWHAGGMKNIPANKRCTVIGSEVAYNIE